MPKLQFISMGLVLPESGAGGKVGQARHCWRKMVVLRLANEVGNKLSAVADRCGNRSTWMDFPLTVMLGDWEKTHLGFYREIALGR